MLDMFRKFSDSVKKVMLTSGEDIHEDDYGYPDDEYDDYYGDSRDSRSYKDARDSRGSRDSRERDTRDYDDEPMSDHYTRGGAARRVPDKGSKGRSSYSDKISELGYTSHSDVFQAAPSKKSEAKMLPPIALISHPKTIKDCPQICEAICNGKMVIVDISTLDSINAQRIADYLGGVIHAEQGQTIRVNKTIFVLAPLGFEISIATDEPTRPSHDFSSYRSSSR